MIIDLFKRVKPRILLMEIRYYGYSVLNEKWGGGVSPTIQKYRKYRNIASIEILNAKKGAVWND